jgi:hypothetical protein
LPVKPGIAHVDGEGHSADQENSKSKDREEHCLSCLLSLAPGPAYMMSHFLTLIG